MRKMLVAMAARPARARHQARRPAAQHAHDRRDAARPSSSASPRRRSTSTPRWPTASGMQEIKQQLEDLSFAALHPKRFAELDHLVSSRSPEREVYLAAAIAEVRARLAELGIDAEVTGRGKHLWSLYEKMVVKGREFDDIFDLVAVRVIVDSMKDCYAALGLHPRALAAGGGPVQGLHRDAQVQPLPEPAHDGHRARTASRSRCRSAPGRCTSGRSGASPPTGRTRTARRRTTSTG